MASYRVYKYTSIGRPPEPGRPAHRAMLALVAVGALVGLGLGWRDGAALVEVLWRGLNFALVVYVAWALARELDPDDSASAFISVAVAALVAVAIPSPGLLTPLVTLGLLRIVDRSTGLQARISDSLLVAASAIAVIYLVPSPFFGLVAALAFVLDGSLREPLRRQWLFGLVCLGGTVVYLVDHGGGAGHVSGPDAFFEWVSISFLVLFALYAVLTRSVRTVADVSRRPLDVNRVRGGMLVGALAALQGLDQPASVAVIIAAIAGLCLGTAFRKGFQAPATG